MAEASAQQSRKPGPTVLVIFGATGDLTHRKLIPSVLGLHEDDLLPEEFAVIGFARRPKSDDDFCEGLIAALEEHSQGRKKPAFQELRERIHYLQSTFDDEKGYTKLREILDAADAAREVPATRIFYLATPPSAYRTILQRLEQSGLSEETEQRAARVIIEKPFGRSFETARELNEQVAASFSERQVYRIDHYLGKETVQNILALRFANGLFEPMWNQKYIDHVQITVAESIGIEGRGGYFEESGIIRDMIQNHLLQVLTLIAMEPPATLHADSVRDEKVKVLRSMESLTPETVAKRTARGQYTASAVAGKDLPGYLEEEGVSPDSTTETFAALRLSIDNWRWAGTPFFLRAGKSMPKRITEVAIHYNQPPHMLFGKAGVADMPDNVLVLQIQPDEGISFNFGSKVPGPDFDLSAVRMDFRYAAAFGTSSADSYERLLYDAMIGDSTLFARRDELEEAWRIVDSVVAGWADCKMKPSPYPAGSWGPSEAARILGKNRRWRRL